MQKWYSSLKGIQKVLLYIVAVLVPVFLAGIFDAVLYRSGKDALFLFALIILLAPLIFLELGSSRPKDDSKE